MPEVWLSTRRTLTWGWHAKVRQVVGDWRVEADESPAGEAQG